MPLLPTLSGARGVRRVDRHIRLTGDLDAWPVERCSTPCATSSIGALPHRHRPRGLVSFNDDGAAALVECRALSNGLIDGLHYRTEGGAGQDALPPRSPTTPLRRTRATQGRGRAGLTLREARWGAMGTRILTVRTTAHPHRGEDGARGWGWIVERPRPASSRRGVQPHPSDVVLIDIMLPGVDGFEVCRSIRRTSDVPIVMVTARADTHDVVAGSRAGADDYLTKAVRPEGAVRPHRALMRRARKPDAATTTMRFGDLEIIPTRAS